MSSKQQYHTQMLASVLAQQEEEAAQYFGIDFVQLCHADHKKLM